jgi:microsomal dipeptidase-like Zn-dependent dipeptidase
VFLSDNEAAPETVLQHINYVAELVDPEHVGIGTDCELDVLERGEFEPLPATPVDPEVTARSTLYGGIYNSLFLHQASHLQASGGESIGPDWECIRHFEPSHIPYLIEAKLKRGYSETEMRGILDKNIMQVAK